MAQAQTKPKPAAETAHDADPPDRVTALVDAVPDDADRILDLGCVRHDAARRQRGNLHAELVAQTAADVVGIDIVEDGVKQMQAWGYDARLADAEAFHLDESFDVMVAGDLIEHLANPGAMLGRVREHLTDDGVFIASTPNAWWWLFMAQTVRGHVHCNAEHTCYYDARTLRQLLEREGFDADIEHLTITPDGVPQRWLRSVCAAVNRLPLPRIQRAPTLLAVAEPTME